MTRILVPLLEFYIVFLIETLHNELDSFFLNEPVFVYVHTHMELWETAKRKVLGTGTEQESPEPLKNNHCFC